MANTHPSITPTKDGPFEVEGVTRFFDHKGEPLDADETMYLCRCGNSGNKPFCDGSLQDSGFTGDKESDRTPDKLDIYVALEVKIRDNRGICSHAGYCTGGLPKVFDVKMDPWIDPEGAPAEKVVSTIRECPSGALSFEQDGEVHTDYHDQAEIIVSKNGPHYVRGGIELKDATFGEGASREHYALCRCGSSKNKPFCDGTHLDIDFNPDE